MITPAQKIPTKKILERFYTNEGLALQLNHFKEVYSNELNNSINVLDIGGGEGYFMHEVKEIFPLSSVSILDIDSFAVLKAKERGINAVKGSILENSQIEKCDQKFDVICFNLVLHHIVTGKFFGTRHIQVKSLENASKLLNSNGTLFIHEICYEGSFLNNFPGHLIYLLTSSRLLEPFFSLIGKLSPSLFANTIGTGVRYRSDQGWRSVFADTTNFSLEKILIGESEGHPRFRNIVLGIKSVRRKSFILRKVL